MMRMTTTRMRMMTARHRVLGTATLLWFVGLLLLLAAIAVSGTAATTTIASSPSSSCVVAVSAAVVSVGMVDTAADPVVMFTSSSSSSSSSSSKRKRMMKMTIKTLSSTSSSTTTATAAAATSSSSASSPLTTNSDNEETSTTTKTAYTTTMNEIMVMFRQSLARRQRRWTASRRRRRRRDAASDTAVVSVPVVGLLVPRGGGGNGLDGDDNGDDLHQEGFGNTINNNVSSLDTDDENESSSKASATAPLSNSRASSSSSSIFDLWGSSSSSAAAAANGLSATASALVERWTREKLQFLDRIALIASSMLKREQDAHLETTAKKKKTKKKKHRKSRHSSLGQSLIGQMLRRSSSTSSAEEDVDTTTSSGEEDEEYDEEDDDLNAITLQSDLTLPGRHFYVVTTAALPWFTGTAVNPLLRAAHLHRRTLQINSQNHHHSHQQNQQHHGQDSNVIVNDTTCNSTATSTTLFTNKINNIDDLQSLNEKQQQHANQTTPGDDSDEKHHLHRWVTLVIPWLELPQDQQVLYGQVFVNEQAQEDYIRDWLRHNADMADAACPDTGLQILFYPARYHSSLRSIFAMGDIIDNIRAMHITEDADAAEASQNNMLDVAILEEPEHCNWFRAPGDGWTKRFHYVIGIVHTNYKEYASSQYSGLWTAPAIQMMSAAMVRAYCHKVIKLSDALQTYAPEKECTSNVHGVRAEFLQQGLSLAQQQQQQQEDEKSNNATVTLASSSTSQPTAAAEGNTAYFIGKLLWAKGLDLMLDLEDYYRQCTGKYFAIDIYGNGPDEEDIKRAFHGRQYVNSTLKSNGGNAESSSAKKGSSSSTNDNGESTGGGSSSTETPPTPTGTTDLLEGLPFLALPENLEAMAKQQLAKLPRTFSELRRQPIPATFPGRVDHAELKQYKIFVNPSISEVLCTTTAEALAMGKFVIIPVHPSNTFFLKFPNCLAYRSKFEFVANLRWALTHEPEPLTMALAREFTWEAATDRLVQHAAITRREALERERLGMSKLDQRIAWFHNELGKGTTGDMLRKIFGAGPASQQVQYQLQNAAAAASSSKQDQGEESAATTTTTATTEDEGDIDDETKEDQDDGLSRKFRRSSFAEAMRIALGDISSFVIQ